MARRNRGKEVSLYMDCVMCSSYYRMLLAEPIERCGHSSGALKINCHGISTAVLRVKDMSNYASVATATIASTVVRTALQLHFITRASLVTSAA